MYGGNIDRAGKQINNCIQQGLNAFISQSRTAQYRDQFKADGSFANRFKDFMRVNGFLGQIGFHHLIIELRRRFYHFFTVGFSLFLVFIGDVLKMIAGAQGFFIPSNLFHFDQIDNVCKILTLAHRQL